MGMKRIVVGTVAVVAVVGVAGGAYAYGQRSPEEHKAKPDTVQITQVAEEPAGFTDNEKQYLKMLADVEESWAFAPRWLEVKIVRNGHQLCDQLASGETTHESYAQVVQNQPSKKRPLLEASMTAATTYLCPSQTEGMQDWMDQ